MSFLSKLKKVVKAPIKVAAKTTSVAARATTMPFKVVQAVAPRPLGRVLGVATAPMRFATTKPLSLTSKILASVSQTRPTAAPARVTPSLSPLRRGGRPLMAPIQRGGMRTAAPFGAAGSFFSKVAAAVNPAMATAAPTASPIKVVGPDGSAWSNPAGGESYDEGGYDEGSYDAGPIAPSGDDFDFGVDENEILPEVDTGGDDGSEENDPGEIGSLDYESYFSGMDGLGDVGDIGSFGSEMKKMGLDIAKGSASVALSTVANKLSNVGKGTPMIPPPPPGLSTPAKIALGVGIGVPVLYLLTRRTARTAT